MFNKKLRKDIRMVDKRVDNLEDLQRNWRYKMQAEFDRLVEALGLTRVETHKVEYVRKGGPEQ